MEERAAGFWVRFADVASGYIFLANRSDLKECQWMPGYISREMFVANKPFYQAFARRAGKEVDTADEFNDLFSSAMQVSPTCRCPRMEHQPTSHQEYVCCR